MARFQYRRSRSISIICIFALLDYKDSDARSKAEHTSIQWFDSYWMLRIEIWMEGLNLKVSTKGKPFHWKFLISVPASKSWWSDSSKNSYKFWLLPLFKLIILRIYRFDLFNQSLNGRFFTCRWRLNWTINYVFSSRQNSNCPNIPKKATKIDSLPFSNWTGLHP